MDFLIATLRVMYVKQKEKMPASTKNIVIE